MRKHILMSLCAGSFLLGACAGKGEQKMSVSQEPDTLLMLVGSYASADQEGIKTYGRDKDVLLQSGDGRSCAGQYVVWD